MITSREVPRAGHVQFGVSIAIQSQTLTDIENTIRSWECDEHSLMPPGPYEMLDLLSISLHWLLLNADPPVARVSWEATAETASNCAKQVLEDFQQYGEPFLRNVDSLDKTIEFLRRIHSFPKKTYAPGPMTSDPSRGIATLLHLSGRSVEAVEEMQIALREYKAKMERSTFSTSERREAIAVYECFCERFSEYLLRR